MNAYPETNQAQIHSKARGLIAIVCVVVALRPELFFSALAVTGSSYAGIEESPLYVIYFAASSISIYFVAIHLLLTHKNIRIRYIVVLAMPIIMTSIYWVDELFGRSQTSTEGHFLLALAFACPAAVAGMVSVQTRSYRYFSFILEPLMLLLTCAVAVTAISFVGGGEKSIGGATYQTAAYIGGLAFNINLYFLLFRPSSGRPKYAQTKTYFFVTLVLLPIQVLGVLMSGGRGGFVLIGIGVLVQLVLARTFLRRPIVGRSVFILSAFVPLFVWGIPWALADPSRAATLSRVFSYVGDKSIDWDGTSGRDMVYAEALNALNESSLFGYGIFSWGMPDYPHNVMLEILLNGGVLYLLACAVALIVAIIRALHMLSVDDAARFIIPLGLYPLVMLQFSGSYWTNGLLWFVFAFIICFPERQQLRAND